MAAIADPVGVGAVSPRRQYYRVFDPEFRARGKTPRATARGRSAARIVALGNAANAYVTLAANRLAALVAAGKLEFVAIQADAAKGVDEALFRLRAFHHDGVLVIAAPALYPHRRVIAEFMLGPTRARCGAANL
jgi:hypothetical protein